MEGKRDDDVALTVAEIVKDDRKVSKRQEVLSISGVTMNIINIH